uniref:phosphoinositide 5-phosphatase n=1 Tax=Strigamia maritima TaxID=126957 RepID=T1ITZ6_STRMM
MVLGKIFRVYHKINNPNAYGVLLEQRNKDETLLFESQAVAVLSSQETEAIKRQYTRLLDGFGCLGVLQLNCGEEVLLYLVMLTGCISMGKIGDSEIFRVTSTNFVSLQNHVGDEERIVEVRKVLNSGTFYFSWCANGEPLDLSLCAQRRFKTKETDNRFFWNRTLHIHLQRFNVPCNVWLLKILCGSIEIRTVYVGGQQARAAIISRLSCERAGTRFNVRGANDDGHVANFVETEQVIFLNDQVSSYVQTRGSIPLFWEQPGVQVGSHKVKMSRGTEAASAVFDRHLSMIRYRYGLQVLVNLLGCKEGEKMLSQMFYSHHTASRFKEEIPYIPFDYHTMVRSGRDNLKILKSKVNQYLEKFSFFYAVGPSIVESQCGAIRTNCLDCLDRTNCVQTLFGMEVLAKQLHFLGMKDKPQIGRFEELFRQLWVINGDEISKIYAGTGALEGKSKLRDGARSVGRTIQNNLLDSSKQEAIDILLLGSILNSELADRARTLLPTYLLHAPSNLLEAMCSRNEEYTHSIPVRIAVGTWNVNGGKNLHNVAFKHQPLSLWLLDAPKNSKSTTLLDFVPECDTKNVDVFAVGFEEIVDLNAGNIMAASTTNQREWGLEIHKMINRDNRYVLLTSIQLVGVCLFVYVRPQLAPFVRDVASDLVKTGLGGATGNKGGVAIRFLLHNTSICFVCAHFAAGQSQYNERNADYTEITRKLLFPMNRTLSSHEYVFWCGDFNYRIDMPIDEVKDAVKRNDWQALLEHDQLKVQQTAGQVFQDFIEGEVNFPPTYKYDIFSDDYDTSDKSRIPAWTDRVLFRRKKSNCNLNVGKVAYYGRGELKTSDHRPVLGIFNVDVVKVDCDKQNEILQDVIEHLGPPDGTVVVRVEEINHEMVFNNTFIEEIMNMFSTVGQVVLIRFVEDTMWITFRDGVSALKALEWNGNEIQGHPLLLSLRTSDWKIEIEKQLKLCINNTIPLVDDEQFNMNQNYEMSQGLEDSLEASYYDEDDGEIHSSSERNSPVPTAGSESPKPGHQPPPRPAPPQRPPPPKIDSSVEASPVKSVPRAGVISVQPGTCPTPHTQKEVLVASADNVKVTNSKPSTNTSDYNWTNAWDEPPSFEEGSRKLSKDEDQFSHPPPNMEPPPPPDLEQPDSGHPPPNQPPPPPPAEKNENKVSSSAPKIPAREFAPPLPLRPRDLPIAPPPIPSRNLPPVPPRT